MDAKMSLISSDHQSISESESLHHSSNTADIEDVNAQILPSTSSPGRLHTVNTNEFKSHFPFPATSSSLIRSSSPLNKRSSNDQYSASTLAHEEEERRRIEEERLREEREREDREDDERLDQLRNRVPPRTVALAVLLLLGGLGCLIYGFYNVALGDKTIYIPLLIVAFMLLAPGGYHVYIAIQAYRRRPGFMGDLAAYEMH